MPKNAAGVLIPGIVSSRLEVPPKISRPEYVGRSTPREGVVGDVYSRGDIEAIRRAGGIAARAIVEASKAIRPGISTDELDKIVHEYVLDHGAYPSTLGYRGFPKSSCTSVNEVICHGIPDDTVLEEGDIVNLDVTAYLDGFHGDTARNFVVGNASEEAINLVTRTEEAMDRGIKAVMPGRAINVIGRAIESYAKRFGYGVVRDFTGHGVGKEFHSGLIIPHYDAAPHYDEPMVEGMVFTIEPMLTLGSIAWDLWADGWTVTTKDKSLTAQFEHTIAVTSHGAEVLTLP